MNYEKLYIDGAWVDAHGTGRIDVENPATMQVIAKVPAGDSEDVARAAEAAKRAFPLWAATPMEERIRYMKDMLVQFEGLRDTFVDTIVSELGSPVTFTESVQVDYQYTRTRSFIELAETLPLVEKLPNSTVYRDPVGVVACITPWNYPLGQIVQKVMPAILTGNTVVLKPSQHTPLTAYWLVEAFHRAGFPNGVINMVTGRGGEVGNAMCDDPHIDMVSFTGSTAAGRTVSQRALGGLKRISMELGGKSPCVILPGADYEAAIRACFNTIFFNAGQTCTAQSRLLIPRQSKAALEALMLEIIGEYTVGDPTNRSSVIGTVASKQQFTTISEYIARGKEEGAVLLYGDEPVAPDCGYYVDPVIFTNVTNDMTIAREEIFGPVLCVIPYDSVEEAVRIANDTPYGLSGAVWGMKDEAIAVARHIRTGNVFINDGPRDVEAPFGGFKSSGIGREGGRDGLLEFTEPQALFDNGH